MFQRSWVVVVLLATLLGIVTQQEALLVIAGSLLAVMGLARLMNRWALWRVRYERQFDETRLFAGETAHLTIEIANRKLLPLLWLEADDLVPDIMPPLERQLAPSTVRDTGTLSHIAALLWFQRIRWAYNIPCHQRGYYFFGPVTLRSGDFFGLFETDRTLATQQRIIVYPKVERLERLGLPAKEPFGGERVNLPVFEDPTRIVGAREYHPDDPMRRVHWKASARTQMLQVRVLEPAEEPQWLLFLNVATFPKHWQGVNRALLEQVISVVASLCWHAVEERRAVGIVANASVPQSDQPVKVAPGRTPHQMRYILEALAAVTSFATMPIETLISRQSALAPWGATLVLVTGIVTPAMVEQLIRLRRVGRKMALVSLDQRFSAADAEPLLAQGIVVHRLAHDPLRYALRRKPRLYRKAMIRGEAMGGDDKRHDQPTLPHPEDPDAPFRRPPSTVDVR